MPQPYPDPNITTFTSFFGHVNIITKNVAMPLLCMMLVVVVFIILKRNGEHENAACFLISTTIGLTSSILLWASGLVAGKFVVILLSLTIMAAIINELDRR